MNFFARQESARRKTRLLLFYYVLALTGIVCACYLASRAITFLALGGVEGRISTSDIPQALQGFKVFAWDSAWMLITVLSSLLIVGSGTLWRRLSLAKGGPAIALSAGGQEILADTSQPDERRLMNVVAEIALASGVPVPRVFVLENELGINAFAAGFTLHDAAIAVTRGALQKLNRDELQGVIAHEFSHILNGDMRLNSWLLGILFGILVTSILGRLLMQSVRFVRVSSGRRNKGGGGVLLLILSGAALWLIGSIGVLFARLIQASISRQREYLADASAVQFTRNPAGLSGALKRIGAASLGSQLQCANRMELSHLLFSSPLSNGFNTLFASHPPLIDRIRHLDPVFDGDFKPYAVSQELENRVESTQRKTASSGKTTLADRMHIPMSQPGAGDKLNIQLGGMVATAAILDQMTPELQGAINDPSQALMVLYALLLSDDDDVRSRQYELLDTGADRIAASAAEHGYSLVCKMDYEARRMIADLVLVTLRQQSDDVRQTCLSRVHDLALADGEISLFEFLLEHRIRRVLAPKQVVHAASQRTCPPAQVKDDVVILLGVLAYTGQPQDDILAKKAWVLGAKRATSFGVGQALPPERAACTFAGLYESLVRLNDVIPLLKGELISACATVIRADGKLSGDETELLRAIADLIEMPLPLG